MPHSDRQSQAADMEKPLGLEERLRAFTEAFSIEVTPHDAAQVSSFSDILPPQTAVHVTHLLNVPLSQSLKAVSRLSQEGLQPVPHIAARDLTSATELENFLERASDETGLKQVMLIGGGVDKPKGPFKETMQVLETGLLDRFGISTIGVAGHPEGSPDIGDQALGDAMHRKADYARQNDMRMHVVTQFFFDAAPVIEWEIRLREAGIELPIQVGLHGITTTKKLIWYGIKCGIGSSLKALTQQRSRLLQLATVRDPGGLLLDIVLHNARTPQSLFAAPHFFPLGGLTATAKWIDAIINGNFEIDQERRTLHVSDT